MMHRSILVRGSGTDDGVVVRITPETAGWDYIGFRAVRMPAGGVHSGNSGADEVAIVVIGGTVTVRSDTGTWERIGERPDPFAGHPYTVYLPAQTGYQVRAESAAEIAVCAAPARDVRPARLITPAEVSQHIRGAGQASRWARVGTPKRS